MRVELVVNLRPEPRRPKAATKPVADPVARAEKQRVACEDRRLRQIALARLIEERIASGQFASLADVVRKCGVSRARVSQVMGSGPNRHDKVAGCLVPQRLTHALPNDLDKFL